MTLITASLYLLCLAFLFGSAVFVYSRDPRSRLNGYYALLALALLGWVGTLFVFNGLAEGNSLLLVGRTNFAFAAIAVTACYFFVAELAGLRTRLAPLLWIETLALAIVSAVTTLIDRTETIQAGQHFTVYGPLFAAYILHVAAYLAGAIIIAFRHHDRLPDRTGSQLRLVGAGTLATAVIAVTTNILLPYAFGDFRFIHVGTLSTILLLAAVGYAVFAYRLFDIRIILRTTLVLAVLVSLALEVYQASVAALAELLPLGDPAQRHLAAVTVALVVNASTGGALRSWLERIADRLIDRKKRQ